MRFNSYHSMWVNSLESMLQVINIGSLFSRLESTVTPVTVVGLS